MNKKKEIVPKLRFPEFKNNEFWLYDFLGRLSTVLRGGSPRPIDEYLTSDTNSMNWLKIGDINKEDKYITKTSERVKKQALDKTRVVHSGDLIMSNSMSFGRPYLLKISTCIHDGWIAITEINSNVNKEYLYYYILSDISQIYFMQSAAGGGIKNLNAEIIKKLIVLYPENIIEQQKIADCLSSLDELIDTERRKLKALEKYKKGLMQKLLPAEGKTLPEWRFPEFKHCGNWEQVTLNKVAFYENGKAHENYIEEYGKYIVVNSKFIATDGEVTKHSNTANLLAKRGETLMVLSDVPNGRALAKCYFVDENDKYTVNQRICRLRPYDIDSLFLFYYVNRNKYFLDFDDGVKQTNLKKSDVLACPLLKPKEKREQQKIADCLSEIDTMITEQLKKIERLETHKKGLMQGLFPSLEEADV